jgi:hypothetical protein
VAVELDRLRTAGESPSRARSTATRNVTEQFIATEASRRKEQVAPLVAALDLQEKPRGCWAYRVTTTKTVNGKASVKVERYDPYEPEARLWTLVSEEGKVPDEKAQAEYRKKKLAEWKRKQEQNRRATPVARNGKEVQKDALEDIFERTSPAAGVQRFTFTTQRTTIFLVADVYPFRMTYDLDETTGNLLRETSVLQGTFSALAGSFKVAHFESAADYAIMEPGLPPFVVKSTARFRGQFFLMDSGEVTVETVYADYRRVQCYDERFEVIVGPIQVMDFAP